MISASSKATLETLERLVVNEAATARSVIEAAYQLGKIDGGLEMTTIVQRSVEKLLEPS